MRNLSLLLFLALAGCAGLPGDGPAPRRLAPPALEETLAQAAGGTLPSDAWPAADWWTALDNPQLTRLIETALAEQPDLRAAAHRLEEARARVQVETARLLPGLEARASLGHQRFSANSVQAKLAGERFGFVLFNPANLHWHLDLWGRDRAAIAAAMGRARARAAELAQARLLLSTAVARTYLTLTAAERRLQTAQALAELRHQRLQLQRVRFQAGLDPRSEVDRIAERDHETSIQVAALARETRLLRYQLAYLAGKGPDLGAGIAVLPTAVTERFPLPRDLPLHLLAHRPDVAAAKALAQAAAQEVKVAKTAFFPDVNLVGFAGFHSVSFSDILFHGSSLAYQIGPTLELPLFQGGRLRASLAASQAAWRAAVEDYNQAVLRAVRQVAAALTRWQEAERRLREARAMAAAADHRRQLTLGLRRAGLADRGQWLEAASQALLRQLTLTDLELERQLAAVDLIEALGGGWREAGNDVEN